MDSTLHNAFGKALMKRETGELFLNNEKHEKAWGGLASTTYFLTTDLMQFLPVLLILSVAMNSPKGYTKRHRGSIGDAGINPQGA
ncbi:MAG: hypothetical protein PHY82_00600 [Lentisphaeria bacterium]|nr:hypothetical protein [Lentisphaeria bacterium]